MSPLDLYRHVARARAFELALADLWGRGLISGEMHLGTGEEAVAAGVVSHLGDGDGLALDHRPTPALVVRGIDPVSMLREMLGREDGLCRGRGGHMHLFSRPHLAASSGIVGAAAPLAAGFALAARARDTGGVTAAFFGDGALNQGMVMESLNLAVAWSLPVVFVCKDNDWAITSRSSELTSGSVAARAAGFGMPVVEVDGRDALAVHDAAGEVIDRARAGRGPSFLLCACPRLDGHFLGDTLLRTARDPLGEGRHTLGRALASALAGRGGSLAARAMGAVGLARTLARARGGRRNGHDDPIRVTRRRLGVRRAQADDVERQAAQEIAEATRRALDGLPSGADAAPRAASDA